MRLRPMDANQGMKQSRLIYQTVSDWSRRRHIPFLGALASLLLHASLLTPVLLGTTAHKMVRPQVATSSIVGLSEEATMTVIFMDTSDPGAKSGATPAEVTSLLPSESEILVPVAAPILGPMPDLVRPDDSEDEQHSAHTASEGDPGWALMFGRYVGQITARIQRAWIMPRTPIASDLFACRVRIVQDRDGRVMEIELARCNGDVRWQTSLVAGIQSASPLPAPPDPDVFSRTLTLEFTALPFAAGGSAEGFEAESRTVKN
jgi:hypothetical protein